MITHIIEYIFTDNDLEQYAYLDMYKLFVAATNSKCIFDIMLYTPIDAAFIHIEKSNYTIKKFNNKHFFTKKHFSLFIKSINITKVQRIFVFGGHCNGLYCYTKSNIIDFNMMRDVFKTNKLHFDAIWFDSCYTATLDTIHMFYDITNYIVTHMMYVNSEGFNSTDLCKILDSKYIIYKKLKLLALDYIKRSIIEKEHSSITIIDCSMMKQFFTLYNTHYKQIKKIINNPKSKKYVTDLCTKWLDSKYSCNNMLDLYSILKTFDNKELINIFDKAVYYKTNGIKVDPKYFNPKSKFYGVNIIIDKSKQ